MQLAFATSAIPDAAYVTDPLTSPFTMSAVDWELIRSALDPAGTVTTFYWTVVESDFASFLELAAWRAFTIGSIVSSVTVTPASGANATLNQPFTVRVSVAYDVNAAGVLQVWLRNSSGTISEKAWRVLAGAENSSANFDLTLTEASSGLHSYEIVAHFRAGAVTGPLASVDGTDVSKTLPSYTVLWQVPADTTPPAVSITSPTSEATFSTGSGLLTLAGTALDVSGVTRISWTNDRGGTGTANGTANWSIVDLPLQPGANLITVTAEDGVGNRGTDTLTVTYTPTDTASPTVTITSPVSTSSYTTTFSSLNLAGTAVDNSSITQVTWVNDRGGSGTASGTTAWSITGISLQLGVNNIVVTARDSAGNVGAASLAVTLVPPDTTPPIVAITVPTTEPQFSTSAGLLNLAGTASDNVGVTQVTWANDRGGGGAANGTANWSVTGIILQTGVNVITITARDAANNSASAALRVTFSVADTTSPVVTITSPTTDTTFSTTSGLFALAGTASDDVAVTEVSWVNDRGGSGLAVGTAGWSVNNVPLQAGVNVITITARDAAGNTAIDALNVTFTPLDGIAPSVVIETPTTGQSFPTISGTINLGGSAADNQGVVLVEWANDRGGSGVAVGTTVWSVANLSLQPGLNTITITARDGSGNQAQDVLVVTYSPPDLEAPQIVVTAPTTQRVFNSSSGQIDLRGTASDNVAVALVTWSNDRGGGGAANGTSNWSIEAITLLTGRNLITITARDAANNVGAYVLEVTFSPPDVLPPTVAISSPTSLRDLVVNDPVVTLIGTANDNVTVVDVTWSNDRGGSGEAIGTDSWTVPSVLLHPGVNFLKITARDAAGNIGSDDLTVTYRPRDTSSPSITITLPVSGSQFSTTNNVIKLGGTASDNVGVTEIVWSNDRGGNGKAAGTLPWTVEGILLRPGVNRITVTAHDAAANKTTVTMDVTYNPADTIPPSLSIRAPSRNSPYFTDLSPVTVSGVASDDVGIAQITWVNDKGGQGTASGTSSWSIPAIELRSGVNNLTITAWDTSGNTTVATFVVVYTVPDSSAPDLAITAPTGAETFFSTDEALTLAGTARDDVAVASVAWSLEGGGTGNSFGTTEWTILNIPLQLGVNRITVTARDVAGNSTSKTLVVTRIAADTTPPSLTISTPTAEPLYTTSFALLALGGTAGDNAGVSSVAWSNDRGGRGTATGTTIWSVPEIELQQGLNRIIVTALDLAGNAVTRTLAVVFAPNDTIPPNMIINEAQPNLTISTKRNSIGFSGTASDNEGIALVRWINDRGDTGLATGTGIWKIDSIPLRRGLNLLTIIAQDPTGNRFRQLVTVQFEQEDTLPPRISIDSLTSGERYSSTVDTLNISGLASDDIEVAQVKWSNDRGGSGLAAGTEQWQADGIRLQLGDNLLTFTAEDTVGRTGTANITVFYSPPDTTPPDLIVTIPTIDAIFSTVRETISVGGIATDDVSLTHVTWQNDRGGEGTATGSTAWSALDILLKPGANLLTFTAHDLNGLTTSRTLKVTYTAPDRTKPVISIHTPTTGSTHTTASNRITLAGTAEDDTAIARVVWATDRGESGIAQGGKDWSVPSLPLYLGENNIVVIATDNAGNNTTESVTITYDPSFKPAPDPDEEPKPDPDPAPRPLERRKDIVLQRTDGALAFWIMNGTEINEAEVPYSLPQGWQVGVRADFNRDGQGDLVLQHTDGAIAFWFLAGPDILDTLEPFQIPPGWQIVASGDFNSDGQADVVLQHADGSVAFWYMDGAGIKEGVIPFTVPEGSRIVAAGDLDRDGHADLILEDARGGVSFWLMKGLTVRQRASLYSLEPGWHVRGAAQLRDEKNFDLILQHDNGRVSFWIMAGILVVDRVPGYEVSPEWRVVAPR